MPWAPKTGSRHITMTDAVAFHRGWTADDRHTAGEVIAWAQRHDATVFAYVPPAGEVAVIAAGSGPRVATFRQGHIRIHQAVRPPFPGVREGSKPGTWNLPLSRYRGV